MKKTSLYLEPEIDRALDRRAASEGVTKAELIRQVLRRAVEGTDRPLITAIGVGEGPGDVASSIDEHLSATDFGAH